MSSSSWPMAQGGAGPLKTRFANPQSDRCAPFYAAITRLACSDLRQLCTSGLIAPQELCWCSDFLCHHRKAAEGVGTKGRGNRDVRRIAAAGDQDPPDARNVVTRVKGVPLAAEIGFEPGGEIHW